MPGPDDRARVAQLLGRPPRGDFDVVVRDRDGDPVVIRNAPLLEDGTPMPTRFWLVGRAQCVAVDRLESEGGVRAAEASVDPSELARAHRIYGVERDSAIPPNWAGPKPSGGVGGTRKGVKCLHAHYAWYLAGGNDPVGRWVADRLGQSPVAAVDCGTNSTRLLVTGAAGQTLERLMRITRLGQGVDATGRLDPDAIERTVSVLREYRSVMDDHGVTRVRMTATSAARDAVNRDVFFSAAADVVGTEAELLGGDEEGCLSFSGATRELDEATGPWLVADIGGGSTELAAGAEPGGRPLAVRSLDIGCVRVTERFFSHDPPAAAEVAEARKWVGGLLALAEYAAPALRDANTLVGLAGTVAALASIDQGLDRYDRSRVHHYRLERDGVEGWLETLAGEPAAARRLRPGMEIERGDVIVGGTVVLAEVMRHFGFGSCLTSESDILDGLVATLLDR